MNKFELICQYCNFTWQINYLPQDKVFCSKCKDSNIRAIDLHKEKVDHYAGAPEFEDLEKNWNF